MLDYFTRFVDKRPGHDASGALNWKMRMLRCNNVARRWLNDCNTKQQPRQQKKCCMILHESLTKIKLYPTSCNIVQQGGQTDATCMLRATMFARCCMKCCIRLTGALRLVFTSDGSRSRREPYALVKTARNKQKQKKKETFPFSSFFFYFCFCFCFRR